MSNVISLNEFRSNAVVRKQEDWLGDCDCETYVYTGWRFYGYLDKDNGRKTAWHADESLAFEENYPGFSEEGFGSKIVKVISRYTPPGHNEHVFYTVAWVDPDGGYRESKALVVRAADFPEEIKCMSLVKGEAS